MKIQLSNDNHSIALIALAYSYLRHDKSVRITIRTEHWQGSSISTTTNHKVIEQDGITTIVEFYGFVRILINNKEKITL